MIGAARFAVWARRISLPSLDLITGFPGLGVATVRNNRTVATFYPRNRGDCPPDRDRGHARDEGTAATPGAVLSLRGDRSHAWGSGWNYFITSDRELLKKDVPGMEFVSPESFVAMLNGLSLEE